MLTLARGDFDAAGEHTSEAARLSGAWGESMAREALMGQVGWLLYETGQVDGLTEALADLVQKSVSAQNDQVWSLAAGLIHAEKGETAQAIRLLREVSAISGDFGGLPHGPRASRCWPRPRWSSATRPWTRCCHRRKRAGWENVSPGS
jgi:hypothetical protein